VTKTLIEWSDECWNPYDWHCTKVSPGCKYCYAERDAKKYGRIFDGTPTWRRSSEDDLRKIKAGKVVFVNNHSDTYHEGADLLDIMRIHKLAVQRPDLIMLMLTKRPQVALALSDELQWPDNLWLGVSVESPAFMKRISILKQVPAKHYFISFEPLLARINSDDLRMHLIDVGWVIVGGESGEMHRPFQHQWADDIRTVCKGYDIPFFYKQGSAIFPGSDRILQTTGQKHEERPKMFNDHRLKYQPQAEQPSLF